ncbi:MAG TPA: glycosyltransferase family 4 protein [Firmicutes bacterium]|jgi:glycosyltransferase involved in cell wall biosynthesis|nr:glycosyltransferase family 4 protein [Bacillota bacterium]
MKIVQIVTRSDSIGGAQIHVRDLCHCLMKRGLDVSVLAGPGPFLGQLRELGIPATPIVYLTRNIRPLHDIRALFEIKKALEKIKPDVVAVHTAKAGFLGRLAAWPLGIPCVYTPHGWPFAKGVTGIQKKVYAVLETLAGFVSSRIIAVCEYDKKLCLEQRIVPPEKIALIPNGIPDLENLGLQCQPNTVMTNTCPPRFVMTARFVRPKNHALLIKAVAPLAGLPWQIWFAGDGPLRAGAETLAREMNLESRIEFLGQRQDIPEMLQGAAGFILISNSEGLPLSILEAMRAGLPIIASDVGGIPETIEDGVNGFLIPKGDVDTLRRRFSTLVSDPGLRSKMGRASREKFESQFRLSAMVEKTLSVYNQAQKRLSPSSKST